MRDAIRRYRNKHKKVQLLKQLRQRKHFSNPTGDIESEMDKALAITDLELTNMKEGINLKNITYMAKKWKKKLEKSKVIRIVRERDLNSSSDENSQDNSNTITKDKKDKMKNDEE